MPASPGKRKKEGLALDIKTKKEMESYGRGALKYNKNSPARFKWYGYTEEEIILHYNALINLINPSIKNILEVGCGSGQLAEILLKRKPDLNYQGFDIVPKNIEDAQSRKIKNAVFYIDNYWKVLDKIEECEFIISCGVLFSTTDPKYVSLLFDLLNSVSKKGFVVMSLRFTTQGISSKLLEKKMLSAIELSINPTKYYFKGKRDFLNQPLIRRNHPFFIWREGTNAKKPKIPSLLTSDKRSLLF